MAKDTIFQDNPKLDVYYKTSDGNPFFTKNSAKIHANTLENKNIDTVKRKSEKSEATKADDTTGTQTLVKLVRKDVEKAYKEKFNEEASKQFTTEQLNDAIEKGEKLEIPE